MTKDEVVILIKRNPISFGCGVLSIVLIAGLYFRSGEIPAAEADLQQKSAEAERYALNIKNAAQLKEHVDEITAHNKTIESRMVRISDLPINQQYFRVLARDASVDIVDFGQTTMTANVPKGGKTAYAPVGFKVSVRGSLPQVLNFLRSLENGTHYCRVLAATCGTNASNRATSLTLSVNLELLGLP
jgi:hypothetical protein